LLDILRDLLFAMEAEPDSTVPNSADLKRILRERIAGMEATRLTTTKRLNPEE
jgi:hypothetical protein